MVVVEVIEELAGGIALVAEPDEVEFAAAVVADRLDPDIVGQGSNGREEFLEDLLRLIKDVLQRTIAIGLVDPGVDVVVFLEICRPRRGKDGARREQPPVSRRPAGGSSLSCGRQRLS